MNVLNRPCSSSKEAFLVAQGHCITTKGDVCYAYDGVGCSSCPKYKEGLKRRKEKIEKEKNETIKEVIIGKDKIFKSKEYIRLRKTEHYYIIEIGKRYSDSPDLFKIDRTIVLSDKEKKIVARLLKS